MNRTLSRALGAALLACGGVALSSATVVQVGPVFEPSECNQTNPYSNPYSYLFVNTDLFGAGIGAVGTDSYNQMVCPGTGGSNPVAGRIGFAIGPVGSIQDDLRADLYDGLRDNGLRLTENEGTSAGPLYDRLSAGGIGPVGTYTPSTGGLSFARVYITTTTGTTTTSKDYLYGAGGLDSYYIAAAANGRYMVTSDTPVAGYTVQCVIEMLADAARVDWLLQNGTTTNASMGLYFGQSVALETPTTPGSPGNYLGSPAGNEGLKEYITVPGRKPLTLQEDFVGANVPAYVNFSASQQSGWGLQVLNNPSALSGFAANASADQTPVDEFVIGLPGPGGVIDGRYDTGDPNQAGSVQNTGGLSASLNFIPVYLQKWLPSAVTSGGTRAITSYYRATNFDSNYAPLLTGYSVAIDTPKAISNTLDSTGTTVASDPNPFTIRVYVDNTGSYSQTPDRFVNMQNVQVTLSLPNGMHAPNDPAARVLTGTASDPTSARPSQIQPGHIGFVDFQVAVDPTVVGAQTYSVVVTPFPNGTGSGTGGTGNGFSPKTTTGTINVATTPRLLIRNGPNLVSPPWEFDDPSWSTILNDTLNGGFQAYEYDAQVQKYVTRTGPRRTRGTWIVSTTDRGNITLGGTPQTPGDQLPDANDFRTGGIGSIHLYPGWNLVGNPYTYAFPLGQLLGILPGGRVLTYAELLGNYTNGSFISYDADLKSYSAGIQGTNSRLQPNLGYWIYANVEFDLQFPPLYDLFIRSAAPAAQPQRWNNWRLQLSAANSGGVDAQNYVGIVRNPADITTMNVRKAPQAPVARGVYAHVAGLDPRGMAQVVRGVAGPQTFVYTVDSAAAGPVTVSWPNLKQIPSNLDVQVKDTATGKSVNARSTTGYTYTAGQTTSRTFQVTVTPLSTVAQRVNSLSTTTYVAGNVKQMRIDYAVTGRGAATLTVLKGNAVVSTVAEDVDVAAGANSAVWAMVDSQGHLLPNGTYTLQVAATGESGKTAIRQATITLKR